MSWRGLLLEEVKFRSFWYEAWEYSDKEVPIDLENSSVSSAGVVYNLIVIS